MYLPLRFKQEAFERHVDVLDSTQMELALPWGWNFHRHFGPVRDLGWRTLVTFFCYYLLAATLISPYICTQTMHKDIICYWQPLSYPRICAHRHDFLLSLSYHRTCAHGERETWCWSLFGDQLKAFDHFFFRGVLCTTTGRLLLMEKRTNAAMSSSAWRCCREWCCQLILPRRTHTYTYTHNIIA